MINKIKFLLPAFGFIFWSCEDENGSLVECPVDEICGCTNNLATNYDNTATVDDGSCEYMVGNVEAKWLYTYNFCLLYTSDAADE